MTENSIMEYFDFLDDEEVEKDITTRPNTVQNKQNFEKYSIVHAQFGDALLTHLIDCEHLVNVRTSYWICCYLLHTNYFKMQNFFSYLIVIRELWTT